LFAGETDVNHATTGLAVVEGRTIHMLYALHAVAFVEVAEFTSGGAVFVGATA
jgi:hypothetical protein